MQRERRGTQHTKPRPTSPMPNEPASALAPPEFTLSLSPATRKDIWPFYQTWAFHEDRGNKTGGRKSGTNSPACSQFNIAILLCESLNFIFLRFLYLFEQYHDKEGREKKRQQENQSSIHWFTA